jgi:hypothetical protein
MAYQGVDDAPTLEVAARSDSAVCYQHLIVVLSILLSVKNTFGRSLGIGAQFGCF